MALKQRNIWDIAFCASLLIIGFFIVRSWQEEDRRDLLRLIDPSQDTIEGDWTFEGESLVSPGVQWGRIQIPYIPPDEYDLVIEAERKEGRDALAVGLTCGDANFAVWLDGFPNRKGFSGLDRLDGKLIEESPERIPGLHLENDRPFKIAISVRKREVSLSLDGNVLLNWHGDPSRLSPSAVWRPRDPKVPLFLGVDSSRVHFRKITLVPVSGQGKRLR